MVVPPPSELPAFLDFLQPLNPYSWSSLLYCRSPRRTNSRYILCDAKQQCSFDRLIVCDTLRLCDSLSNIHVHSRLQSSSPRISLSSLGLQSSCIIERRSMPATDRRENVTRVCRSSIVDVCNDLYLAFPPSPSKVIHRPLCQALKTLDAFVYLERNSPYLRS